MEDCENLACQCRAFRVGDTVKVPQIKERLMTWLFPIAEVEEVYHSDGEARLVLVRRYSDGGITRGSIPAVLAIVTKRAVPGK